MARAEPAIEPSRSAGSTALTAVAHFGVATAPFGVTTLREAKGQAFVLSASGSYVLSPVAQLEVRAPLILGSVAQPAGSYVDALAWGNPQLGARYWLVERTSTGSALTLSGALELGAPVATHDTDLLPNRLLSVADGIEGHGHPELFTPGVVPITPSAALEHTTGRWQLNAELRLPVLLRVSDADLPRDASNPHRVGLTSVLSVGASYRLSQRFSLGSTVHLAVDVAPTVEQPGVSRLQDFERLSFGTHFGSRAALLVDLQTAIAGELGGNTVAGGLRFGVSL